MGSYFWYDQCPQCNNSAHFEQVYRSREFFILCPLCGYRFERIALLDRKVHPLDFKRTKEGNLIFRETEKKGFGVMWISRKNRPDLIYSLKKAITPSLVNEFIKQIASSEIDQDKSYLTRWDDETKTIIAVVGNAYNPFDMDPSDKATSTPVENAELFADEFPIPF